MSRYHPPGSRPPTIHRRKLFGGRATAEQVHREALRGRCPCGAPPAIRIRSYALEKDLAAKCPDLVAAMIAQRVMAGELPSLPTFPSVHGPMVLLGTVFACDRCKGEAERAAAKHPDWIAIDINRGPGPDNPVVGVPGSFFLS